MFRGEVAADDAPMTIALAVMLASMRASDRVERALEDDVAFERAQLTMLPCP